jgi:hypothetical protein
VNLLVVWCLIVASVGIPWFVYSRDLDPGRFIEGIVLALFAGVLGGMVLAVRTFALASNSLGLKIGGFLSALIAGAVGLLYFYFMIMYLAELYGL